MITYASSPVPRNAPVRMSSFSIALTYASAVSVSAQVSIFVRIASSLHDAIVIRSRLKLTV